MAKFKPISTKWDFPVKGYVPMNRVSLDSEDDRDGRPIKYKLPIKVNHENVERRPAGKPRKQLVPKVQTHAPRTRSEHIVTR